MRLPARTSPDEPNGRIAELEHELEHLRRLALLGTLASGISHEFNNILTPVLVYAEMAQLQPEDPDLVRRALEKVVLGVTRAAKISEAILALSSSSDRSASCVADVRECAEASLLCLVKDPSRDGIAVSIEIDRDLKAAIEPIALHQVFLNLLLNARNAMAPHGGRLTITARRSTGNSTWPLNAIEIKVQDTGCGISPGFLPRIFDDFATLRSSPSSKKAGHGLGLSICKRLIENAGGSIFATSKVGEGACFSIKLLAPTNEAISKAA